MTVPACIRWFGVGVWTISVATQVFGQACATGCKEMACRHDEAQCWSYNPATAFETTLTPGGGLKEYYQLEEFNGQVTTCADCEQDCREASTSSAGGCDDCNNYIPYRAARCIQVAIT